MYNEASSSRRRQKYHISSPATRSDKPRSVRVHWELHWWSFTGFSLEQLQHSTATSPERGWETPPVCRDTRAYKASALSAASLLLFKLYMREERKREKATRKERKGLGASRHGNQS